MQFNNKKTMLLILTLLVLLTTITVISATDNSTTEVSDVTTCDNSVSTETSHDTSKNNDNIEQTNSDSFGSTHSNISTTQSTSTTKYTNSNSNSGQLTPKVADSTHTSTQSTTSSSTEKQADTSQKTSTSQTTNSNNQVSSTDSNSKNTSTTKDSNNTLSSTNSVKTNTNSIDELNSSTNKVSTNLVDEKTQLKTYDINADGSYTVTSYDDLYNAIEDIKTSGTDESYTIYLGTGKNETFTVTDSNQPIVWGEATSNARNLVIDGQGLVTIDGFEKVTYFIYVAKNYRLTLQNISFTNYHSSNTNYGLITNYGTLNVVNCSFFKNYVLSFGLLNNYGKLTVNSSTFIENQAYQGGAIQTASSEDVYIIDSTFAINTAEEYGGALAHTGNGRLYIINSIFTENNDIGRLNSLGERLQPKGGAIYCYTSGDVTILNSTFDLNSATGSGGRGAIGGAIYAYNSNLYINNSKFIQNTAVDSGGGNCGGGTIYLNEHANCTINNSEFIENGANLGGAIYTNTASNLVINSSKFTENSADYGGVIYINGGTTTINSSTFSENTADYGGIIYNSGENLEISSSEFTKNTASIGGVIYNTGDNVAISNSEFTENSAVYGGAIVNFVDLTIEDSTFKNNHATFGGAIYSEAGSSPSTLKIIKSEFTENSADYGGAVYNSGEDEDNPGTLTIENSEFYTNTATYYGGAIYNDEYGDLTLTGNTFKGNEGYYKDTIFTNIKIKMNENTIIMSDYDVNTFEELNMYSPIIDTTADTDSEAERKDTIVYDISHPSGKKTSEIITMDSSTFETCMDYIVNDGGVYTIDIVYRDSKNYISYNVFSHDVTHITLDSSIVANAGHKITINGYLISTNEDKKYDDYSNKNVTVYINGELKYKELNIDENGHFEFEINPIEGYNSIYVVYDGYIIDRTTYIAGSSNITGFNTNDHNAIITAVADPDNFNVTQSTVINGFIYDLDGNPLEGTITVQISNGTETTVEASKGEFQYYFEPLTEGTYTFIFSFADDDYTAVSDPVYVTVVRTNTNIIIDTSDVKIGEDSTIKITLHGDFGYDIAGADLVVSVNGANKAVTDHGDGSYTIQTGKLTEGTYTIIAYFEGDNIYYGSQNIATFTLSKFYTNIDITYTTPEIGSKTTITATLTDDQGKPVVGRNVVISLNGVNHTNYNTNENGEVYIVTGDLTAGMYTIEAYFDGDDVYYGSHATTEFNLARTHTILEIKYTDTEIVGEKGTVTITLTDDQGNYIANAPVTVMINGVKSEIDRTNNNGQIIIYTDVLTASTFTIEAYYDGNDTYYESHASETFSLSKIITYLEVTTENIVIGETGTITATLTDDQGKYIENAPVTISINGVDYNHITDKDGQITIQTDVLTANTYTIEAYYEGNNTYYESHDSEIVTLSKLETMVHIDHLDEITPGEEVTITGILTLSDGSTPVAFASLVVIINGEEYEGEVVTDESGHFSIPYTVPSNGQLDIVVLYRGSDIYENSYDEDVDTSDLPSGNRTNIPTTTTVGGIVGEYGETVNLTAIVLDEDGNLVPEGQVLFKINDVTVKDENGNILYADVVNGIARLPYTITNSPKNYTIMAVYQGTDTYLPSRSNYALLIVEAAAKIPTTTIVDSITGQYGETVNLTATVYDEDGNLVDEGKLIFKINDVTLKDEEGNVIYVDVENGVAKLPYTITNNPKNYTILAVYQGTDKYIESRSDYATLTVEGEVKNKIPTTTVVEGITGQKGETVNLTATVYDENGNLVPEGQVLFKLNDVTIKDENGNILYADVIDGVARLPYTITNSPKNYTLLAIYQGTDNYYSSRSDYSTLYVVAEDTKIPTVTYVDSITAREGETVNLTATVYDKNQNKVTEGQVYFEIDNQIITDANGNILYATVVDGLAKLPYTVTQDIGNYTLKAVYTENNKYYGSESDTNGSDVGGGEGVPTLTVVGENYMIPTSTTVNGVTAKQGDTINLTANVVDEFGNPVDEGQLSFKIDGVSVTDTNGNIIYVDVADGVAKLPYTVTQDLGNYTITAEYGGTNKYLPSQADDTVVPGSAGKLVVVDKDANITTNIVVDDAIQQWGDVVKFTATITDEYGNPVTGGKVAFKLNGVTIKDGNGDVRYVQVVDGKAELYYTVTNNVKDYALTAVYSGYDTFEEARSLNATLTVTPRSVNMTTDKLDNNIKSGDTVTFKATISEYDRTYTDNGVVVFKLNGKTIKDEEGNPIVVDVNNGVATLDYTIPVDFAGKDYNITAVYTNNNYLRAEANNTLTTVRSNVQTELNPITVSHGQNANLYMVLYDENGNQLERETKVAIKINGHTIIHMNTTAGVLNATIPASEITQTTNRIDVVLGENQGYYELRLNTTLRVEN